MIRQATPDDAAVIAEIYNASVLERSYANCDVNPIFEQYFADALASSAAPYRTYVLERSDAVVAYSQLKPWSSRPELRELAEIAVYVLPGHRHIGAGGKLLLHLIDAARAQGLRSLLAIVLAPNRESIRGLTALGFRSVATLRRAAQLRHEWIDMLWFQKDLLELDTSRHQMFRTYYTRESQ